MKNFKKLVGEKIKRLRLARELTQEQLAAHLGIDKARVSDWERGEHLPEGALKAALLKRLKSDESLIDISPPRDEAPVQYVPTPREMSQVYNALVNGIPERRLLGLFLLTGDDSYYQQALEYPDAAQFAQVIKKFLSL